MAHGKRIRFTEDLTGQRFGLLVVIGRAKKSPHQPNTAWICRCDCGKTVRKFTVDFATRKSCGCNRELHGKCRTSIYSRWCVMITRCTQPQSKAFCNYGARGITVCDRWKKFTAFYADMGEPPTPAHSIGRIDNDGPYSPENCRWETIQQQTRNTRRNHNIEFNGRIQCLGDWCLELDLNRNTVRHRLAIGWSVEKALTTPQPRNPNRGCTITYNGETHPIKEWCRITGLGRKIIEVRLRNGWPVEKVLAPHMRVRKPK